MTECRFFFLLGVEIEPRCVWQTQRGARSPAFNLLILVRRLSSLGSQSQGQGKLGGHEDGIPGSHALTPPTCHLQCAGTRGEHWLGQGGRQWSCPQGQTHTQLCLMTGSTQLSLALPKAPPKLTGASSPEFLGVLLSEEHS